MTCSMVVNSKSGNTRMVSGAIKRALQAAGVEFVHAAALSDDADPEQVMNRVSSNLAEDAELVGWAMCQGKMGPAVKQRYEAMLEQDPDNARFKMLLDNWVAAKDHPTKEDLDNMAAAAKKAVLGE